MIRVENYNGLAGFGSATSLGSALGATAEASISGLQQGLNALQLATGEMRDNKGCSVGKTGRYTIGCGGSPIPVTGKLDGDTGFRTFLGMLHVFRDFASEESGLGVVARFAGEIPGMSELLKLLSSDKIGRCPACVDDNLLFDLWKGSSAASAAITIWNAAASVADLPRLPNVNFREKMQDLTRRVAAPFGAVIPSIILALSGETFQERLLRTRAKSQAFIERSSPVAFSPANKPIPPGATAPPASGAKKVGVAIAVGGAVAAIAILARS